jgi:hypothetical protein
MSPQRPEIAANYAAELASDDRGGWFRLPL